MSHQTAPVTFNADEAALLDYFNSVVNELALNGVTEAVLNHRLVSDLYTFTVEQKDYLESLGYIVTFDEDDWGPHSIVSWG